MKDFLIGESNQTQTSEYSIFTFRIAPKIYTSLIASDESSFQLSPILLGITLTLLIVAGFIILKIYSKKRTKSNDTLNNSKQSNSLLCSQDATKVKYL